MRKGTGGKVSTWTTSLHAGGERRLLTCVASFASLNVLLLRLCCLNAGHLCATKVRKALLHLRAVLKRSRC